MKEPKTKAHCKTHTNLDGSWRSKKRKKTRPDAIGAATTAQGEVDAGEKPELTATIVSFKDGEGAFLACVLVFDAEDAVVDGSRGNQKREEESQNEREGERRGSEEGHDEEEEEEEDNNHSLWVGVCENQN